MRLTAPFETYRKVRYLLEPKNVDGCRLDRGQKSKRCLY